MPEKIISRREWNKLMLAGVAGLLLPRKPEAQTRSQAYSFVLGMQTYSLRDRSRKEAIETMRELNITSAEVWQGHIEPREYQWTRFSSEEEVKAKIAALVEWRQQIKLSSFNVIAKEFKKAGIKVQAYAANMNDQTSDHDMELAFKIARALGTDTLTTSATITSMKRIDGFAQKYKVKVGMHNHSHVHRPNDFSSPESFSKAMAGCSAYTQINLDIGHFVAANFDPIDFMKRNHEKIVCIHVKDRKKNQGDAVPFGEGDTPIKEVLQLIKDNQWNIPANIEYEYNGADTKTELERCINYCRAIV